MAGTEGTEVKKILDDKEPSRFVYSPNYWQWFKHQKDHGLVPDEIRHCDTLADLYDYLGVDIFSRNVYCDPEKYWFGGLCDEITHGFSLTEKTSYSGKDRQLARIYSSPEGDLNEELVYVFNESTLVQIKFPFTDYLRDYDLFLRFVAGRRWHFNRERYQKIDRETGGKGIVIAGEFFSPLKMLHLAMGPVNAVYFLMEMPEKAMELIRLHEDAQLECIEQTVKSGVKVVMSMDNLDTMFHPPDYVETYSSSYYRRASDACHRYGAKFFIHACGQQKDNLRLISSYGVDGLEGVATPPLGDVRLTEAMQATHPGFIITGGISAMETRNLGSRSRIFEYVGNLFREMLPYRNRFIFSSGCNTAIDTSWQTIKDFRDAWMEYRDLV